MGQALYRKYRSKSLDEIVGQEHITVTLKNAINSGRIIHAYLFTGPRGVGKTSIARILAHELNNVPYVDESSHLDIIEIDAASNGGVEEVRDLRDKVHIAPSSGKYKVYIIDEVHMMTTSAFNALLKTLEEPPAHAIFILATTEAHKLPVTIISRTQRFTFKPVPKEQVVGHLRHIADVECIDITDEALELIAEHSEGSFRDSISILDQASSAGLKINKTGIEQLLGVPAVSSVDALIHATAGRDAIETIRILNSLYSGGYQASAIAKIMSHRLRDGLLTGNGPFGRRQTMALLTQLLEVPASPQPARLLELALLDTALGGDPVTNQAPQTPSVAQPSAQQAAISIAGASESKPATAPLMQITTATTQPAKLQPPKITRAGDMSEATIDEAQWQSVLAALSKQYNTLYGIIRMARPEFLPGKVRLTFGFAFHQKRANDSKNKQLLMAVTENVTGHRLGIECLFDRSITPLGPPVPGTPPTQAVTVASLDAISTIFGGGEVIEN